MNWIKNFVKPKIKALVGKDIPNNLWEKCTSCERMIFHRDLTDNLFVCTYCEHHMRISALERMKIIFDNSSFSTIPLPDVKKDPLKFKDIKKYSDRIKESKNKTSIEDAIVIGQGTIQENPVICVSFDFHFMGGSMGMAVGEGIIKAVNLAIKTRSALVIITSSGGARMQEGIFSLMQMARTIAAIKELKKRSLPYITVYTDPTSGGVTASFAMLGDIHISEPKATICFAGKRVIEQVIKQKIPDDFQTAEYLLERGMIDTIVHRKELASKLGNVLSILMHNKNSH